MPPGANVFEENLRTLRVLRAGATRAASVHEGKPDAIARARELAQKAPLGQVKVHGRNGVIQTQTEYTYGQDRRRTPG